ncbi:MAG: RNase adapter RapZ [Gammaproteobacteria bacterium]|nr:RNase adapter RapZ [Gammaproteobacteria bacterium]
MKPNPPSTNKNNCPKLIIVSGRSGSGKTTALQALEDMGSYCVDNLPAKLIPELVRSLQSEAQQNKQLISVGVDARNLPSQLSSLPEVIGTLKTMNISTEIIFLDSNNSILMQRFSATRRKHPLSDDQHSLAEAIDEEHRLLLGISAQADLVIDTSQLNVHQLRETIKNNIGIERTGLSLQFISFGFKKGVPIDADFVYDVRCLPNPHWQTGLRELTGKDAPVISYLENEEITRLMVNQINDFLQEWIPHFEHSNRAYLTVAIGCTGGQHRSVYVAETLAKNFQQTRSNTQLRHREIG